MTSKKRLFGHITLAMTVAGLVVGFTLVPNRTAQACGTSDCPAIIQDLQKALKRNGYNPGPIDGIPGPRTRSALTAFRQAAGLDGAQQIDEATAQKIMEKLGLKHDQITRGGEDKKAAVKNYSEALKQLSASRPGASPLDKRWRCGSSDNC